MQPAAAPKSEPTLQVDAPKNALADPAPNAVAPNAHPSDVSNDPAPHPVGRLRRAGSINIKTAPVHHEETQSQPTTIPPLDDERLHACWEAMLSAMKGELPKLAELLKDKPLRIDEEDMFSIIVSNSFVESEIKPHLIRMLTYLRAKSGRPNLNCKTEVVYEEKEAKAYAPRDKYDVMQQSNPALETFRILFPEVDY